MRIEGWLPTIVQWYDPQEDEEARMGRFWQALRSRPTIANILMGAFILLTAVGAGLVFVPAGLIVAGITCGILGFLLGLE